MKQFFALAALFAVLGVSAQEKQVQEPKDKMHPHGQERMDFNHGDMHKKGDKKPGKKRQMPTVDEQVARFDQYGVNASQKKELKSLLESRDKQMKKDFEKREKEMTKAKENFEKQQQNFDKKLEKILNNEQYAKFKEEHQKKSRVKAQDKLKEKSMHKVDFKMHQQETK